MSTEETNLLLEQANELEEILELMPGDLGTINSLVFTYLQAGEEEKASQFALQLRSLLVANGDYDQLKTLANAYLEFAPTNPIFRELAEDAGSPAPVAPAQTPTPAATAPQPQAEEQRHQTMSDISLNELAAQLNYELDLGEFLKQQGSITENVCDQAVEMLIQNSANALATIPLTLLYELSNIEHINMQRIYATISHKTNTPYINISRFSTPEDIMAKFDLKIAQKLGIAPFGKFGNEVMIACLNPLDTTLKETIAKFLNTKVHIYLTSVEEIQKFYEKQHGL